MKALQINAYGTPADVVSLIEAPALAAPGPGQVLLKVLASPINPSDIAMLRGLYGYKPPLGGGTGNEGIGRVEALGEGVTHLKVGDRVMLPLGQAAWVEHTLADARVLIAFPAEGDARQLAMLGVNPITAKVMLESIPNLAAGDWVIQNAANSGVGRAIIALAQARGVKTVNIVRRESLIDDLKNIGADVVLIDGPDLAKRVGEATGRAQIKGGFEAVGGPATGRLVDCMGRDSLVHVYGSMTWEPCLINGGGLIFKNITVRGFWLTTWMREVTPAVIGAAYQSLVPLLVSGKLNVPVAATFKLDQYKEAFTLAESAREGKVLFEP